jgi:hypothetical protein
MRGDPPRNDETEPTGSGPRSLVVVAGVVVLVIIVVALHLFGVIGPSGH